VNRPDPADRHRGGWSPDDLLTIRTSASADRVLVVVDGDVDMATAPRLRDGLQEALGYRADTILVDLTAVSYIGSHGVAALLDARADAEQSGAALVLILGENHLVRRVLAIAGVDQVLALHRTVEDACAGNDTESHGWGTA
jgi:anti-sigma B factor antagonist